MWTIEIRCDDTYSVRQGLRQQWIFVLNDEGFTKLCSTKVGADILANEIGRLTNREVRVCQTEETPE